MEETRDRLIRLSQELTDELTERIQCSENPFIFRGDTPERREGGSIYWNLWFWFKGVDVVLQVRSDIRDEEIQSQIRAGLEQELDRVGLENRFQ